MTSAELLTIMRDSKVIYLNPSMHYVVKQLHCPCCTHQWVGTARGDTVGIECPNCKYSNAWFKWWHTDEDEEGEDYECPA